MIVIPHTPGDNYSITNVKMAILKYGALAANLLAKASEVMIILNIIIQLVMGSIILTMSIQIM